jgi:hypothetical protein
MNLDTYNVIFDQLDRISDKCDQIGNKLSDASVDIALNTASLQEHMRRTEALEQCLDTHKKLGHSYSITQALSALLLVASITSAIVSMYFNLRGMK